MYARLLAALCLLSCSVNVGRSEPMRALGSQVEVYLKAEADDSSLPIRAMQAEMNALLAPAGFSLRWVKTGGMSSLALDQRIVSVELRGSCHSGVDAPGKFKGYTALASTAIVDGEVLPFTWINCAALNQFLRGKLQSSSTQDRDLAYGRALGRLLAHEFYHVLARTEDHTSGGVSKARFNVADLLSTRLEFEHAALSHLRSTSLERLQVASASPESVLGEDSFSSETEAEVSR